MLARKIPYFRRAWFHIWLVTKYARLFTEPFIIFVDLLYFFSLTKFYLLIILTACFFTAVFSAVWFRSLVRMSFKVQILFRFWSWLSTIISQNWYWFMESQPWNLPNIVMAALTAPLFRTWSPISDLQRMSVWAFDDQFKETPYLFKEG